MQLYSEAEIQRRLAIIKELVKSESWKIIKESVEYWSYAKSKEVIALHAKNKKYEAEELSRLIYAVERVFAEPAIIIQESSGWLKKLEWLRKVMPNLSGKKQTKEGDEVNAGT